MNSNIYYNHKKFAEAKVYFQTLVKRFPGAEEKSLAMRSIMDSYFALGKFRDSEIIAKRILGDEKICLGQRMMLFAVTSNYQSDFLWALLESPSFKFKLQSLVGGGAAPRVNIKDIKKIVVIKPIEKNQKEFSKIRLEQEALCPFL